MPYITNVERFGIEKGRQEGLIAKGQEDILRILEVRFDEVPVELREQVGRIETLEALEMLLVQAVTVQSLEAFKLAAEQSTAEVTEGENAESDRAD